MALGKRLSEEESTLNATKRQKSTPLKSSPISKDMTDQMGRGIDLHNEKIPVFEGNDKDLEFQVLDICIMETEVECTEVDFYISGCTKEGNPVLAHVGCVHPYFYVKAPPRMQNENLDGFMEYLNSRANPEGLESSLVVRLEILEDAGLQPSSLLKVYASSMNTLERIKDEHTYDPIPLRILTLLTRFFSSGLRYKGIVFPAGTKVLSMARDPLDLFLFETKLSCLSSWVKIPADKYRREAFSSGRYRHNIHLSVRFKDLQVAQPKPLPFAPLRMLSIDIETEVTPQGYWQPDATNSRVYQICCMVSYTDQEGPIFKKMFSIGEVDSIEGIEVKSFDNEYLMLKAWQLFFDKVDADVLIGHNVALFDYPFLLTRLQVLKLASIEFARLPASPLIRLGRYLPCNGLRWDLCPLPHGRVFLDTMHLHKWNSSSSASLKELGPKLLGKSKGDVDWKQINELQKGGPATRRRLAKYCAKDTWLSLQLAQKMNRLQQLADLSERYQIVLSALLSETPNTSNRSGVVPRDIFRNSSYSSYSQRTLLEI